MASVYPSIELKKEIQALHQEVTCYRPGRSSAFPHGVEFPEKLCIGLYGRTGSGKTSLINSLKFAVNGSLRRTQWLQVSDQKKAGVHTTSRKIVYITNNISVIDNRGLDDLSTVKSAIQQLDEQLDGHRGYASKVDWRSSTDVTDGEKEKDKFVTRHSIDCVVSVFSAVHDLETSTAGLTRIIDFLHGRQGRYPIAVVTHVDIAEKKKIEGLKTVLRRSGISEIFEVANLTERNRELEERYVHSVLSVLERCMFDGDETLIFKHYQNPARQTIEALQREMEMERDQILREKEMERDQILREKEMERNQLKMWMERNQYRKIEEYKQEVATKIMEAHYNAEKICMVM